MEYNLGVVTNTTSADNIPGGTINVSAADNIKNIMEECGDFVWLMFFLGIIVGIIVSCIFYCINKFIKNGNTNNVKTKENVIVHKEETTEEDDEKTIMKEDEVKEKKEKEVEDNNEFYLGKFFLYFGIFFAIMLVIVTIIISTSDVNNNGENNSPTSSIGNSTNNDIYTKITTITEDYRTISIQASEKIEGLVIEVRFLDKDGNILKTQRIDVGNIAPGNEFTYKLTRDGMQIKDLDRINSFTIRVTDGTIKE